MPLNSLFRKPSTKTSSSSQQQKTTPVATASDSSIFPAPETTYELVCSLLVSHSHPSLHYCHPSVLAYLQPADIQQFLTELYGFEPSLHWTWIGCCFPPADVKFTLSCLDVRRSRQKALYEFCKKTQADEAARKERLFREQSRDAGEAYVEGERRRKWSEIEDLDRIMDARLKREKTPGIGLHEV